MLRFTLATRNPNKTREFSEILGPDFLVSDLTATDGIPEIEETGRTFEENAILKAVVASRYVADLVVSDDSGLEVEALDGAPGVRSARYAGERATDRENIEKLLSELGRIESAAPGRSACFRCVLALAEAGKLLRTFHGTVHGSIVANPRGNGGFGYDPIFVPKGHSETLAELGEIVKNQISHRARAIAQLRSYFDG